MDKAATSPNQSHPTGAPVVGLLGLHALYEGDRVAHGPQACQVVVGDLHAVLVGSGVNP